MFPRMTRRNLLVVLLSLSLFGLFIYSKIGSKVKILKSTTLTSKERKIGISFQNGGNQPPNDKTVGNGNDVPGVRRLSQEWAQHEGADESTKEVDEASHAGKRGEEEKFKDFMKEEGFMEGNGLREGTERSRSREEGEEDVVNERAISQVLPRVPISSKPKVNVTRELTERGSSSQGDMQQKESKPFHPSKNRIFKIGWTRDREERRQEPKVITSNATAKPALKVITSHYFADNPADIKVRKIFLKCLSKMPEEERKAFAEFERHYRENLPPTVDQMGFGQKWIALSQFMQSLGREQRLPDVINIGAKKSGTTALGWFISLHPQIAKSFGNEVHFFDKQYEKGLEFYKSRMGFAKSNQLVFEKTPRYLVTDSAPGHALKDLPSGVKFIICIRDPLKRALSDFRHDSTLQVRRQHKLNHNFLSISERTPETEGARFAAGAFDKYGNVNNSFDSVRTSSYVKHFRNWLKYFPRDKFLIIDHQRLVDDAFHELHRIEVFLGLTPFFQPSMFYFDKKRKGTCVKGKTYPCPPRSSPGFLPAGKLTPEQEEKLRNYFRPLNREFVQLVGDNNFTWVDL